MTDHAVATVDELDEGEHIVTQIEGREVGIFKVDGEYLAYTSWCAHQSGPICEGKLTGTTAASFDRDTLETETTWIKEGKVLTCPWHGWEYDITSGDCLSKEGIRLPSHEVRVEDGEIVVTL